MFSAWTKVSQYIWNNNILVTVCKWARSKVKYQKNGVNGSFQPNSNRGVHPMSYIIETKIGMFMKISHAFVFNKMVLERYYNSLQNEESTTWNGEEMVKLWVKNGSRNIKNLAKNCDPGIPIDLYYSMWQDPCFHHERAFYKKVLLFHDIWLLLCDMVCTKV